MKKNILIVLLMISSIVHAQDYTYVIDFSYKDLSTTACNLFASPTTVDNFVHKTTIGFPSFTGATDYAVNLACTGTSGTEYQIIYPFKQGNRYQIAVNYRGLTSNSSFPVLAMGLNKNEKAINSSTNCTGPQPVNPGDYTYFGVGGATFAWPASGNEFNIDALSEDKASLSVTGFPNVDGSDGTIQIRKVQIAEWCNQPSLGTASGLTGTLSYTTPPAYGYVLNFTAVPDATSYNVEWYDVTNSAVAGTFTITGPGYLNTSYITTGHTYRYRVQALAHCRFNTAYSDYSPDLAPPAGSCAYGPLASSLTATVGSNITLSWPAIAGATQYNAQYIIYQPGGITRQPVTLGTSTNSATFRTPLLIGSGWVVKYRVQANCGSGFGSYSDYSASYFIQ